MKERVAYYNELMIHKKTNYAKVFINMPDVTKEMLIKRCQEYIDINDTATPVIELIENGTTDVSHLIQKAKGR